MKKKSTLPNNVIHDQKQEHKIGDEFATSSIRLLRLDFFSKTCGVQIHFFMFNC